MKKINNTVILWGIDDVNTLGVVREFGENHIDFEFIVKGKLKYASKSKFVKCLKNVKSNEEALEYLVAKYSNADYKPIIISTGDGISVFIDSHRDKLEPLFILPTTMKLGFVDRYTDKVSMTELAESFGILCPKSRRVVWNSDIDDVDYPCLIKPSHMTPGYPNEFKYKICNDKASLQKTLANVRHQSVFILQEFIQSDNDLVIYGVRLPNKKTIFAGSILGYHRACGICSFGHISKNIPSSVDLVKLKSFLDYIDYQGPFGFDFGTLGEKAFFYEINLRNDGTCHCFYQAGAKLLIAYIYSCANEDYSELSIEPNDAWFIDEVHDFENVVERKISYADWRKAMKQATIFRFYHKEDIMPWKYVKHRKWFEIFKYVLLNRYRIQIVAIMDRLGIKK